MIPSVCPQKKLSDENLMRIPTHITEQQISSNDLDLLIDKRTLRIIFKIKKYFIIYIWNKKI